MWQRLAEEFPGLEGHRDSVGFAVNQEYVQDDYRPRPGDEVAFIPPVSGGAGPARDPVWMGPIAIGRAPIDVAALERAVTDPHAGAVVTFAGTTRDDNAGRNVIRLEYEAYEPMALSEMRRLAREAGERWQIVRIAISHRVGLVDIGETSVAIAVSAAHRAEAFEACRFAIDRSQGSRADLEEGILRGRRSVDRLPDLASARPRPSALRMPVGDSVGNSMIIYIDIASWMRGRWSVDRPASIR